MPPSLFLVELTVADWLRSLDWYATVLGLPLLLRDDKGQFALFQASLSHEGEESGSTRIALKAGQPSPGTVLLTFAVGNLDEALQRLAKQGVTPEGPIKTSPEGYRRSILRDPDGHRLSLFEWHSGEQG
jgi:predicted enzyme related to lactoylglutathione lyase